MRIYRIDGKEQTEAPILPPSYKTYPHKVEYIDTDAPTPAWTIVCDNPRDYTQELADAIHGKTCHFSHIDECGYHDESATGLGSTRQRYLMKADSMIMDIESHFAFTRENICIIAMTVIRNM